MASAGHQEDAERCASSAVASESDTDYSWGWLDSGPGDPGDPVVAALWSREARNEAGVTTSIDAQRAHPSADEQVEPLQIAGSGIQPHENQEDSSARGEERCDNAEPNLCQERMNICMKKARRWRQDTPAPFGGAQVVVTGDFCQLPPVKPFQHCIVCGQEMEADDYEAELNCRQNHGPFKEREKWAFMSKAWGECKFAYVDLKQIHRQNDEYFLKMLQKCRLGIPFSRDETETLINHPCNVTNATRLFSTRIEVTKVNTDNFNKLQTPIVTYRTLNGFVWHHKEHPHLEHYNDRFTDGSLVALKDHRLERQVQLRIGMVVVLQVNLDLRAGLCNGSQGIICGFENYDPAKLPRAKSGKVSSYTGQTGSSGPPAENPMIYGDYAALKERQVGRFMGGQKHNIWPRVLFHNGHKRTIYADCTVNSVGSREPLLSVFSISRPECLTGACGVKAPHDNTSCTF